MIYQLDILHEDDRRTLAEFGNNGSWKVCKYLTIKEDCVIGDHYHKLKDEIFLLSKGGADVTIGKLNVKVKAPVIMEVKRGIFHLFKVKKGSILIGLASEVHDDNDDHKL